MTIRISSNSRFFSPTPPTPGIESQVKNLEELLEQYYHNSPIVILNEEITRVAVPAESPYRLELKSKIRFKNGKTEKIDLFVKLFDQDPEIDIRVDLLVRFKKEIEAYTTTIPILTQFQSDYGVAENKLYGKLFAKCLATRCSMIDGTRTIPDNTATIVLENLRVQGYKIEDVSTGFDITATRLIVQNLAQFHAVPLALRLVNLDIFRETVIPCIIELKEYEKKSDYFKVINELIQFGIQGHPELAPYSEAIDTAIEYSKLNSWFRKSFSDQTWVTMCHTRYWILNIMLKRNDKKKPVSSKIVDLQKCEYLHCCTDLAFFMFTSVQKLDLEGFFDNILRTYFETFIDTLEIHDVFLGPYTYDDFLEEFNIQGPKILVEILECLRYVACEGYDPDGEPVVGQKYRTKVRDVLLVMIERGWLE